MVAHQHAEVLRAYADGAKIQLLDHGVWVDVENPCFGIYEKYRVKPERRYPITQMRASDLFNTACMAAGSVEISVSGKGSVEGVLIAIANAALHHAVDAGQLMTREASDARVLAVAEAVQTASMHAVLDAPVEFVRPIGHMDLAAIIAKVKP